DILEEYVNVNGIPLKLVDTAGIRETEDVVERIGVERSREALNNAEVILYLLDKTQGFSSEDDVILDGVKDRNVMIIVNNIDLDGKIDIKDMQSTYDFPVVLPAITDGPGIKGLEEGIQQLFFSGGLSLQDSTYVS